MTHEIEFKTLPFDRGADAGNEWPGAFEGLAAAFHNIDAAGDIIAPGAFARDLSAFMAEGFIGGCNHDWDQPIGRPLTVEERPDGLFIRGSISDTAHGRDVRTLLRDGVVRRLSIGFRTLGRERLESAEAVRDWWAARGYAPTATDLARAGKGARLLTRLQLVEVSPVALAANTRARVTGVKAAAGEPRRRRLDDAARLRAAFEAILARSRGAGC